TGLTITRPDGVRLPADAKTFVSPVRIQDKRYILGTEIALAAVIAAAGVSRVRPEQQRIDPRTDASATKPTGTRLQTDSQKANSFTVKDRIDKRYITGAEVALGAVFAAGAISRVRREFESEKRPVGS